MRLSSKTLGISQDEFETLGALVDSQPYNTLLKAIERLVFDSIEMDVLRCSSEDGDKLRLLKARAEGAKKTVTLIRELKESFKSVRPE